MDEKKDKGVLIRFFESIEMNICVVSLFLMTVITFMQVVGRYGFNYSFSWSEEISRFLLIWITFGGSAYVFKNGAHIGVTYFIDKLPPKIRKNAHIVIKVITIGFFIVLGVFGLIHTMGQIKLNQIAPATGISMGIPSSAIAIGSLLVIIRLTIQTVEDIKFNKER